MSVMPDKWTAEDIRRRRATQFRTTVPKGDIRSEPWDFPEVIDEKTIAALRADTVDDTPEYLSCLKTQAGKIETLHERWPQKPTYPWE